MEECLIPVFSFSPSFFLSFARSSSCFCPCHPLSMLITSLYLLPSFFCLQIWLKYFVAEIRDRHFLNKNLQRGLNNIRLMLFLTCRLKMKKHRLAVLLRLSYNQRHLVKTTGFQSADMKSIFQSTVDNMLHRKSKTMINSWIVMTGNLSFT